MGVNVTVDDALLTEVIALIGTHSGDEAVHTALKRFVQSVRRRQALDKLKGIGWEGDLDAMREGRLAGETP